MYVINLPEHIGKVFFYLYTTLGIIFLPPIKTGITHLVGLYIKLGGSV